MVAKAIQEIRGEGLEILEIQTSSDYLIMILGKG
jgi:biotin operon repressor